MKRLMTAIAGVVLLVAGSGCCHHLCGGGGGYGPSPCGPCGANYGGYQGYSQAYVQPSYATAALPSTGFVSSTAAAPACNCTPGVPTVNPY